MKCGKCGNNGKDMSFYAGGHVCRKCYDLSEVISKLEDLRFSMIDVSARLALMGGEAKVHGEELWGAAGQVRQWIDELRGE